MFFKFILIYWDIYLRPFKMVFCKMVPFLVKESRHQGLTRLSFFACCIGCSSQAFKSVEDGASPADMFPAMGVDTHHPTAPKPKICSQCLEREEQPKLHGSMCQKDVDLIFTSQQQAIKASFGHQQVWLPSSACILKLLR